MAARAGKILGEGIAQPHVHGAFDLPGALQRVDRTADVMRRHHPLQPALVVQDHHLRGVAERHVRYRAVRTLSGLGREVADVLAEVLLAHELLQRRVLQVGGQLAGGDLPGGRKERRGSGGGRHAAHDPWIAGGPHAHDLRVEPGLLVDHLPEHGEQALAHLRVAREDLDGAALQDAQQQPAAVVHAVADPGVLDPAGDSSVAGALVHLPHGLQGLPDPAALRHDLAGGKPIAGTQDVALPDVVSVDPDLLGQQVHDPLDRERGLVGAEAAHRAARRVVRVDRLRLDVDVRHAVGPAGVTTRPLQHLHADRRVGARITDDPRPYGGQMTLRIGSHGVAEGDRVTLRVHPDRLLTREDRPDRTPGELRGECRLRLDRQVLLAPERAPVRDQLDLDRLGRNAEHGSDLHLVVVYALTLRVDLEMDPRRRRRHGQARLRLEKRVLDPLRRKRPLQHVLRG